MYRILVLDLGFDPSYVLDKMQMYEASVILQNMGRRGRYEWERTRLTMYTLAQVNSSKKLKIKDILKFDWDEETEDDADKVMTEEDKKRLREKAKQYSKIIQNG